jgi:hypothetical protein
LVRRLQHPNQRNIVRIMFRGAGMIAEQNVQEFVQERVSHWANHCRCHWAQDMPTYDWE